MQRFIKRLLCLCFLVIVAYSASAIDERYAAPELRGSQIAPDSTSMVMDTVYFNSSLKPLQSTFFVKNLITFQIDEAHRHLLPDEFEVTVTFKVHYTVDENGTPETGVTDDLSLTIGYNKINRYDFKAVYIAEDWWYKAEIEIIDIEAGTGTLSDFRDALVLTNEILINREYQFSCTNNAIQTIHDSTSYVTTKGELMVYWSPERAADEYDLEWTYIDSAALINYRKVTIGYNPDKVFPGNSTRVSLKKEKYFIPLLYEGSGILFFRVRAVQVKQNGQRIESTWSSDYSNGLGLYIYRGHDTTMNWQASTSFAEDGKRKSVVQYFDGSLKSRQTITKDNTTDTTVIAETYYDNQGRPVIQVMPAPSLSGIIKYNPAFNQLNGSEYVKDVYDGLLADTCHCRVGAPAMDTSSGTALYYSPNNALASSSYHKYIPDAKGFAFAETRYTPDNTGRISIQGGVADTFQIGRRHETIYTYNAADQEELDALFGTEVGNASHYFKNTVQDANGQVSISYVDMHGRTIATALAGQPVTKLDTLTAKRSNWITKKLLDSNSNVIKGMVIESSKGLVVTETGDHHFVYSLVPDSIRISDCYDSTICYDCIYDLEITISEECNDTSKLVSQPIVIRQTNYQIDNSCDSLAHLPVVDTTLKLSVGTYLVTKRLKINKKAMDYYRDSIFLVRNTCHSLEQTIQQQKELLRSTIDCDNSCDSCDNIGLDRRIREQMLADVTPPFGQYANLGNIDQFSIFWFANNDLPPYQLVSYTDENGNLDPLEPHKLEQPSFVQEFKPSWAETLLEKHPEYPKLVKFEQLAASNEWDVRFQNTETYQAAVDSGFLNPGNFATHPTGSPFSYNSAHRDPFFTDLVTSGIVSASHKTSMQDSLLTKAHDTSGNAISMWSLATVMAHCSGGDNTCLYRYKSIDSAFAIGSECSGDRDIAWQYFREMYLQEKRELIAQVLNQAQQQSGGPFADLKELVDNHTPNFYDPNMMPPAADEMPTADSAGRSSLTNYINNNCAAYVSLWWQELKPCDFNATDSLWLIPKLLEVCRQGGDSAHLFGASTVKPTSTYSYKSFDEVIKAYRSITGKSYDASCNVYLISAPQPYDQQPVYYDKPVYQKPDSCECATISTLYNQYELENVDSSFSAFIYRTSGTQIYQGVLDTLRMACDGQINCSFLKEPVTLPPALQCGVKNACISCVWMDSLVHDFKQEFPFAFPAIIETDSLQSVHNRLFGNYINAKTGFSKTAREYLAFMETCTINQPVACVDDSLGYLLDQFNIAYKNSSTYTPAGQYNCDTTDYGITAGLYWAESVQNGILTFPSRIVSNPGTVTYSYSKPLQIPANGLSIETRLKLPLLDSTNCDHPDFQFQLRPEGGWVNALFFSKSIPCGKTVGAFDLADSLHPHPSNHLITTQPEMAIDMTDWVKIRITIQNNKYTIYVADTFLLEVPYTGTLTKLESFRLFFGTRTTATKAIPYVDYVKVYNGCNELLFDQGFNSVTEKVCPDLSVRFTPDDYKAAFASYYNEQRNTSYTTTQIDSIYHGSCNGYKLNTCGSNNVDSFPPLTLCGKIEPVFAPVVVPQHTVCDDTTLFAFSTGTLIHDAYRDSLINSFNDRYLAKCLGARYHETFTLEQRISEYHYTLYYYDQAGNLLKTIPPAGVDVSKFGWASAWRDSVVAARRNRQQLTPQHMLPTQYRYNTLNQVVTQQSPDGGLSEFWYDRLGRLVVSRNARQKAASGSEDGRLYSYTKYDSLGRVTEVGQVSNTSGNGAMTDAISRNPDLLQDWLVTLDNRRGQITSTVYDEPYPGFEGVGDPRYVIEQKNLRNRVSYTTITDTGTTSAYNQGTFYTYDILGNVDHLLQDYGHEGYKPNVMNKLGNRWKKFSYQYDLISGKVNMVMYQHDWDDGFFHRYSYDAENRLTLVETSRDSLVWEKDARYEYYRHGPLARVTLGDQQVQGIDYAYTLQGWLKGVNSTGGSDSFDMGGDGRISSINRYTARDAMGLSLNYFANDYTPINGTPFPGYSAYLPAGTYRPLYNGNISSSTVYQKKFDYYNSPGGPLIFYNYSYDQLNRLTGQDTYNGFNATTNSWAGLATMGEKLKERVAYDPNGNILKYLRKSIQGAAAHMDSLNYFYYAGTNQLKRITDSIPPNTYTSEQDNLILDIDGQPDNNYRYDAIGNLIKDSLEQITSIKWNVYGKIQEINRVATAEVPVTRIKYSYDALGNRISQIVTTSDNNNYYTWFVRDGQGNIMSTYTAEGDDEDLEALNLKHSENFLYGSSRLGTMVVGDGVNDGPGPMQYYRGYKYYGRGYKQYELTNHLGNVLATVSDKKFAVPLSDTSSLISYYEPDIVTAQDYYPFGMMSRVALPNSGVPYKFGFNGQEMNNEVKGLGNSYTAQYWEYDSRIGRRWNLDPKPSVGLSQYSAFNNNPISLSDPLGDTSLPGAAGGSLNLPDDAKNIQTFNANSNYSVEGRAIKPVTGGVQSFTVNDVSYTAQYYKSNQDFAYYLGSDGSKLGYDINTVKGGWRFTGQERLATATFILTLPARTPGANETPPAYILGAAVATGAALSSLYKWERTAPDISLSRPLVSTYPAPSLPIVTPFTGHGNKLTNWNPQMVYEFSFSPTDGKTPILKYGIADMYKTGYERPERQLPALMAIFGNSVRWKPILFTPDRASALAAEKAAVGAHMTIYNGAKPRAQILP